MSDELKLLPCPFCGCHGVTMASDPSNPKRHAIKCEDCPGMADFHSSTAEQAIAAWNRRPTPEQSGKNDLDLPGLRSAIRMLTPTFQEWIGRVIDALEAAPEQSGEYAKGYADAADIFAVYVEDHCVDGADHANAIRTMKRPDRAHTEQSGEDERLDNLMERFKIQLTPYGMLVRALRIVAGTLLYDMARHLGVSPATLSAMEFGRKPVTYEMAVATSGYFHGLGIHGTLPAIEAARAAMDRSALGRDAENTRAITADSAENIPEIGHD